jgi:hypothetical protein
MPSNESNGFVSKTDFKESIFPLKVGKPDVVGKFAI